MTTLLVSLLILFTLASAFFSTSETTLFSLSPTQTRLFQRSRLPQRKLIAELLQQPRSLLVTILMMNVLVNLLIQNTASSLFAAAPGWLLKVGLPLVLTLFFGEIIPKSIALPNNERLAPIIAPPIGFLHWLIAPLRRLITTVTSYLSRFMFFFLRREKEISHAELQHALALSQEHGLLSREEAELISGYLKIQDVGIKELMRPREDILWYDLQEPLAELTRLFTEEQVSRLPVCDGGIENLLGVIEADLYFVHRHQIDDPSHLAPFLRRPLYVPESMAARSLLSKLDEKREALALVVDEYGSISGLITREDLVEVIVGEIVDRRDETLLYTRANRDVVIASGKLELDDFNELFNCPLESESHLVTLGGWLTEQMGAIPPVGAKLVTEDYLFHVLASDPNRIRRIYVRRLAKPHRKGKNHG